MEVIAMWMLVMTVLTPVLCIASFIVGYNINAQKKIFTPPKKKKTKPTEDEMMLERIENAQVYKTEI